MKIFKQKLAKESNQFYDNIFKKFYKLVNKILLYYPDVVPKETLIETKYEIKEIKTLLTKISSIIDKIERLNLLEKDISKNLYSLCLNIRELESSISKIENLSRNLWVDYNDFQEGRSKPSIKIENLRKLREIKFEKYKPYFFGKTDKYLLAIHGHGLTILNYNLEIIKEIYFFENALLDRLIFKQFDQDKILLYSADLHFFIFVDLVDFSHKIIRLPESINYLSPIYYWKEDNSVLIAEYKLNKFFEVCLEKNMVMEISEIEIQKKYSIFYEYILSARKFLEIGDIVNAYPEELKFIFKNFNKQDCGVYDFVTDKILYSYKLDSEYFDFAYYAETFITIKENELNIFKHDTLLAKINSDRVADILGAHFAVFSSEIFVLIKDYKNDETIICLYEIKNF